MKGLTDVCQVHPRSRPGQRAEGPGQSSVLLPSSLCRSPAPSPSLFSLLSLETEESRDQVQRRRRRDEQADATSLFLQVVRVLRHPQRRLDLDFVVTQEVLQETRTRSLQRRRSSRPEVPRGRTSSISPSSIPLRSSSPLSAEPSVRDKMVTLRKTCWDLDKEAELPVTPLLSFAR